MGIIAVGVLRGHLGALRGHSVQPPHFTHEGIEGGRDVQLISDTARTYPGLLWVDLK